MIVKNEMIGDVAVLNGELVYKNETTSLRWLPVFDYGVDYEVKDENGWTLGMHILECGNKLDYQFSQSEMAIINNK